MTVTPAPLLEASIEIDASPEKTWAVVSDLRRMGEWSPECRRVFVLGTLREGARTLNLNRRGFLVWPTNAKVVRYEPNHAIAWRILENTGVWSYEILPTDTGVRLVERRELDQTPAWVGLFTRYALGGVAEHDQELLHGMDDTLRRIKTAAERG